MEFDDLVDSTFSQELEEPILEMVTNTMERAAQYRMKLCYIATEIWKTDGVVDIVSEMVIAKAGIDVAADYLAQKTRSEI